jgi:hypothetical protein
MYVSRPFIHPGTNLRVRHQERSVYDPVSQVLQTEMQFVPLGKHPEWRARLTQRQWFPREVEALLHYNGFGKTRFLADFDAGASFERVDTVAVRSGMAEARKPR